MEGRPVGARMPPARSTAVARGVPGPGQRGPDATGLGFGFERRFQQGNRAARIALLQPQGTQPKERQRGTVVVRQSLPVGGSGSRTVAEFLAEFPEEHLGRRIPRVFLHRRGQPLRRFRGSASANRVGQQVPRGEAGHLPEGKKLQSRPVTRRRFGHQPVGVERFAVLQPAGGIFRARLHLFRQSGEQLADLRLHVPGVHQRRTRLLPGRREREPPESDHQPAGGTRPSGGHGHAPIVLRGGDRGFWGAGLARVNPRERSAGPFRPVLARRDRSRRPPGSRRTSRR